MYRLKIQLNEKNTELFGKKIGALLGPNDSYGLDLKGNGVNVNLSISNTESLESIKKALKENLIEFEGEDQNQHHIDQMIDDAKVIRMVNSIHALSGLHFKKLEKKVMPFPEEKPNDSDSISCEESRMIGAGIGTGRGYTPTNMNADRHQSIRNARMDAMAQASKRILKSTMKCTEPCQLQFSVAFGEPDVQMLDGMAWGEWGFQVPLYSFHYTKIGWELKASCVKELPKAGEKVTNPPLSGSSGNVYDTESNTCDCAGYSKWGYSESSHIFPHGYQITEEMVKNTTEETLKLVDKAIANALESFPHCSPVSCSKEEYAIYIGPIHQYHLCPAPSLPEDANGDALKVDIHWKITMKCSK